MRIVKLRQRKTGRPEIAINADHITAYGVNKMTDREDQAWVSTVAGQVFDVAESYEYLDRVIPPARLR